MNRPFSFRFLLAPAIVFVLAFDIAFFWQHVQGAYRSEYGGHPDEAAHYVTGLMVHDYLVAGCPWPATTYADNYYKHYPKIGLGIWPPLFYLTQAAWTLPFGVSHVSLLLLMCTLAALVALMIYRALVRDYGELVAGAGALIYVSLPLVREYYSMTMAETLSSIWIFGAALFLARFIEGGKSRHALLFGFAAAMAILTKGTGLALALMVPIALALTSRWDLLKRPALWGGAVITMVLAGPWTWVHRNDGKGGWEQPSPSLHWSMEAVVFYLRKISVSLGPVLGVLFLAGLVSLWLLKRNRAAGEETAEREETTKSAVLPVSVALVVAVLLFSSTIPAGKEARHLIPALPAAMVVAMAGAAFFLKRVLSLSKPATGGGTDKTATGVCVIIFLASIFPIRSTMNEGFGLLAADAMVRVRQGESILISSDAIGEGMFIAAVAQLDEARPTFTVKRASKELASSQWNGGEYKKKYEGEEAIAAFLREGKYSVVVADTSMAANKLKPHHTEVRQAMERDPKHFDQVKAAKIWRDGVQRPPSAGLFVVLRPTAPPNVK